MIAIEETFLGGERIPLVWRAIRGQDAPLGELVGWLREHRAPLTGARDRHGAVLLRGFRAIDSAPAFAAVLEAIARELMEYVGGSSPREPVYGRITTASGLPGSYSLPLHQEMAYQASRPDAVALFCEIPPEEGGETPVADARAVTARLDPAVRARFGERGVAVRRALPGPERGHPDRVPRPWSSVFLTADRAEVERIARERGWRVEWQPGDSMLLWQEVLPAFRAHPRSGERVWANQVHSHAPECLLRWALRDGRRAEAAVLRRQLLRAPQLLDQCFHGDGTPVSGEDAGHVWDVLQRSEIPLAWERGDVLLLDNVLAMHGRRPFRGRRRILAGLIRD